MVHWRGVLLGRWEGGTLSHYAEAYLRLIVYRLSQYFYNDVYRYSPEKVRCPFMVYDCVLRENRMNGASLSRRIVLDPVRPMLWSLHLQVEGSCSSSVCRSPSGNCYSNHVLILALYQAGSSPALTSRHSTITATSGVSTFRPTPGIG